MTSQSTPTDSANSARSGSDELSETTSHARTHTPPFQASERQSERSQFLSPAKLLFFATTCFLVAMIVGALARDPRSTDDDLPSRGSSQVVSEKTTLHERDSSSVDDDLLLHASLRFVSTKPIPDELADMFSDSNQPRFREWTGAAQQEWSALQTPWKYKERESDSKRRHTRAITNSEEHYELSMGGLIDGHMCRGPVGTWYWDQEWESNVAVRMENVGSIGACESTAVICRSLDFGSRHDLRRSTGACRQRVEGSIAISDSVP